MIEFSFSQETLLSHIVDYYETSLQYFKRQYLPLFLRDGDLIPIHKAYLCPLCLNNYIIILFEEKAVKATSDFDLDHYPQKSIGGSNTILVCKSCNNEAGHSFEFDLKKHLELTSFGEKGLSHQVAMKTTIPNVGRFSGLIWKTENDQWEVSLKPNQKLKIKPLDDWLEYSKHNKDWKIDLTISNPQDDNINKSMLKSAYLYCFALWGYEFAFSQSAELIRNVIKGNGTYPMNVMPLKLTSDLNNYTNLPKGVCFISKPQVLRSFVVNIEIKDKEKGFSAVHPVFIPNPTENKIDDLKKIQVQMDNAITGDVNFVPLNRILSSTPFAYTETWRQMEETI